MFPAAEGSFRSRCSFLSSSFHVTVELAHGMSLRQAGQTCPQPGLRSLVLKSRRPSCPSGGRWLQALCGAGRQGAGAAEHGAGGGAEGGRGHRRRGCGMPLSHRTAGSAGQDQPFACGVPRKQATRPHPCCGGESGDRSSAPAQGTLPSHSRPASSPSSCGSAVGLDGARGQGQRLQPRKLPCSPGRLVRSRARRPVGLAEPAIGALELASRLGPWEKCQSQGLVGITRGCYYFPTSCS